MCNIGIFYCSLLFYGKQLAFYSQFFSFAEFHVNIATKSMKFDKNNFIVLRNLISSSHIRDANNFSMQFWGCFKKGMQFLLFNKHQTEFFHGKTWGEYFWCFFIASLLIYWVNMWFKFLIYFILKILQENLFNKILLS